MRSLIVKLCIGVGVPYEPVELSPYAVLVPIPNSEGVLTLRTYMLMGVIEGLLLHQFRDFSVATYETRLSHLVIELSCNNIRHQVLDINAAVPVSEAELDEWLEKTCKCMPSKVSNLLVAATLPLIGGN